MIVVHGGAGRIAAERHARLRAGCRTAAEAGYRILAAGGSALDAVVAAVRVLEDDPEFNAGTGSVLTRGQEIETDAAVMDGATRRVGAVGAVPALGKAVALARAVLDDGEHVLIVGPAALAFGAQHGIAPQSLAELTTERAWRRFAEEAAARASRLAGDSTSHEQERVWRRFAEDAAARASIASAHVAASGVLPPSGGDDDTPPAGTDLRSVGAEREGGTVGAVARDQHGTFAAATSTGGTNYKRAGRVGDSPIPGAGTWADTNVAISATGDGEAILRVALARTIALRAESTGDLRAAVAQSLAELRAVTRGEAGLIAVDARGAVALHLSPTMPVAWVDDTGRANDTIDGGLFMP